MKITVTPAAATHAPSSNFSGVAVSYLTGQSILVTIEARDQFRNLRTTASDTFLLKVLGQTDSTQYGPVNSISKGNGVFTGTFKFLKK
jgi:hypothetical protein